MPPKRPVPSAPLSAATAVTQDGRTESVIEEQLEVTRRSVDWGRPVRLRKRVSEESIDVEAAGGTAGAGPPEPD